MSVEKNAQFQVRMQKLWLFYGGIITSGFREELQLEFDGLDSSGCMDQRNDGWNKSEPATKLDLGHKFNTTEAETKLCKRLKTMVIG